MHYMYSFNLPLLLFFWGGGGGGFTIANVAHYWTYETAVALNCDIANGKFYKNIINYII